MEGAVQPGWEERLQRHSHDRNVKQKSECTDLSALLRELLLDDEDVIFSTSNTDNQPSSCALQEESTLRTGTRNRFSTTNSNIHQHSNVSSFSSNSRERRIKRHSRGNASDRIGVHSIFLSQRQSLQAMTLDGALDEETFKQINKINRRESWKRAEQRHMLDSENALGDDDS